MEAIEIEKVKGRTAVNIVSVLSTFLYFFFSLGFWFHTTSHPVIFGKYSLFYFVTLCLLALFSPYVFFVTRFLLTTDVITLRSGKSIILSSRIKLASLVLSLLFVLVLLEVIFSLGPHKEERLETFHPFLQIQAVASNTKKDVNRWGFRGEEIEKTKPPNTYRIFVMGGSTVHSDDVPFEKSHPRIMEKYLRAHYPEIKIEVQNAGMHWYTSEHSLINFLTKVQDFNPDLIITYHGINDLYRGFSPKAFSSGPYKEDYSHYYGPLKGMIDSYFSSRTSLKPRSFSYLSGLFQDVWFSDLRQKENFTKIQIKEWKSLPSFERNMRDFANIVKSKNISLLMASEPFLYRKDLTEKEIKTLWIDKKFMVEEGKVPDLESLVNGMNAFNEKSRAIAEENGIPFIDLEKMLPKTLDYLRDDVHYTERGNRVIGEALAKFIIEEKMIEKK